MLQWNGISLFPMQYYSMYSHALTCNVPLCSHSLLRHIWRCTQKFLDWVIKKKKKTTINTCWEATQSVIVAKLTRLTHKIVILLHLVAESCTICSSHSMWPVRKLLDTPSYGSFKLHRCYFPYGKVTESCEKKLVCHFYLTYKCVTLLPASSIWLFLNNIQVQCQKLITTEPWGMPCVKQTVKTGYPTNCLKLKKITFQYKVTFNLQF
jgi:hypothetical protein